MFVYRIRHWAISIVLTLLSLQTSTEAREQSIICQWKAQGSEKTRRQQKTTIHNRWTTFIRRRWNHSVTELPLSCWAPSYDQLFLWCQLTERLTPILRFNVSIWERWAISLHSSWTLVCFLLTVHILHECFISMQRVWKDVNIYNTKVLLGNVVFSLACFAIYSGLHSLSVAVMTDVDKRLDIDSDTVLNEI